MSKSIKFPTKKEKIDLEIQIEYRREQIAKIGRFPELLEIDSEQKTIDYRKNKSCYKCTYLKYESSMEKVREKKSGDTFYRFCFANKEKAYYCSRIIGGGGSIRAMLKIKKPRQSLCTSYQLSTEISPYLLLIRTKYRWARELIEFRKSELIRLEEEKKIAILTYEMEKTKLIIADKKEVKSNRYSERGKDGKFGSNQPNSIEENSI